MQRNDDADRIVGEACRGRRRSAISARRSTTTRVVHDAQLLYLLARHFPTRLGSDAAGRARNASSAAVSGNRRQLAVGGLHAARRSTPSRKAAAGSATRSASPEIGKDGRERALTLPAGAMPKVSIAPEAAAGAVLASDGPLAAYYVVNESGFDRNPPAAAISQGIEIIREFLDAKGNAGAARRPSARNSSCGCVCARRSAIGSRRSRSSICCRAASSRCCELQRAGRHDQRRRRSGARDDAGARPRHCRIGVPDKSGLVPDHVDVREDRLVLYGDVAEGRGDVRVSRPGDQRRHVPDTAGVRRRDVQPHDHRAEPGRQAGDRQAVTRRVVAPARPGSATAVHHAARDCALRPHAPLRSADSAVRPACGPPTASCCARHRASADDQYRLWVPLREHLAGARRRVPAERGPLVLLAPRGQSDRAGARAVRTYRGGAAPGRLDADDAAGAVSYRLNTKTPAGKLRQIAAALWLGGALLEARAARGLLSTSCRSAATSRASAPQSRIYFGKVAGSR